MPDGGQMEISILNTSIGQTFATGIEFLVKIGLIVV